MQAEGFRWVEWSLTRRSLNPFHELKSIRALSRIYREEAPSLIHHDTIKPNFYGSLAFRLSRSKTPRLDSTRIINTFMGLGYLFSPHRKARLLRGILLPLLRYTFRQISIFTAFSNQRDLDLFIKLKLILPENTRVIVSEFVDVDRFSPGNMAHDDPRNYRVLMAARLLWDKGVQEFVDAAREVHLRNEGVEFWLAGQPDKENPHWVPEEKLREWESKKWIRWLGHCNDMPSLLQEVDVAALPTHYNEGLPRFLVESASSGLPIVATDIPACRAIVRDGENGFIIAPRNAKALANAIDTLIADAALRSRMSQASRSIAVNEFDEKQVLMEWLALYQELAPLSEFQ
jgi:glycosyltransferase involved in cell wall biosynthesis